MSAEAVNAAPAVRGRSLLQDAVRRFFRNPTGVVGLAVVLFFALTSLLAPLLRPYDATTDRKAGVLRVDAVHRDGVWDDELAAEVDEQIDALAFWLQVDVHRQV